MFGTRDAPVGARWRWSWPLLLAAVALSTGCATYAGYGDMDYAMEAAGDEQAPGAAANRAQPQLAMAESSRGLDATTPPAGSAVEGSGGAGAGGEDGEAPARRLMIYTAEFTLLVASSKDAVTRFVAQVEEGGGYLARQDGPRVTVRVPAARFREVIDTLPSYGAVLAESIDALDVTMEYRDVELRIAAARKSLERLYAILDDAKDTKAILEIEKEIRRLTEEIERLEGRRRLLADRIAFSTITVQFDENAPEARKVPARSRSRFQWLNRIGVEHVLREF